MSPEDPRVQIERLQEKRDLLRREHAALKQEEEGLGRQRASKGSELAKIEQEISKARQALRRQTANGDGALPLEVTDHALVQYLERLKGVDVDRLKRDVVRFVEDLPRKVVDLSLSEYHYDEDGQTGKVYVRDGKIISIID